MMNKKVFVIVLCALFALEWLEPVRQGLIQPFTAGLATLSAAFLHILDPNVIADGIVIASLKTGESVAILAGCNGVEAMICLTAALLAYPTTAYQRIVGLVVGYLAIQSLNIMRIISLFYLLQWNKHWFEWSHLYLWQGLLFLDVLITFMLWIRWVTHQNQPIQSVVHE